MTSEGAVSRRSLVQRTLGAAALGGLASSSLVTGVGPVRRASAMTPSMELPDEAYTTLGGDMKSCRILNGMWQLSGAHGYRPQTSPAVSDMRKYFESGTSWSSSLPGTSLHSHSIMPPPPLLLLDQNTRLPDV